MQITSEAVQNYLFPGQESITAYDWIGTFTAKEIADQVTRDMREQTLNVNERITEALGGHIAGAPSYEGFRVRRRRKGKAK